MRLPSSPALLMAALAGLALLLVACSADTPEPTAASIDEYFQRVQALLDTQERDGEAIGQRFAEQLTGDETSVEEVFAALEAVLPEILPQFEATFVATANGLVQIAPPPDLLDVHGELIEAYDDLIKIFRRGVEQLDSGEPPSEALAALFAIDPDGELAGRFSEIARELAAASAAAGIDDFVGGGPLVIGSTTPDDRVVVDRDRLDDTPRIVGITGVPGVDAVIDALLGFDGDFAPIESLLTFVTTECTLELGAGGPPKCWQVPGTAQVEGTEVEVFPTSVCEAQYEPRGVNITRMLGELVAPEGVAGSVRGVHAVYQLDRATTSESYWPDGDYAVVFLVRQDDSIAGVRVRITDGAIVRIDFGCGPTPPAQLAVPGATDLLARSTEPSRGAGPGLSVEEAVSSRLAGPLLVNGYVVISGGETRLCQTLDQSFPPACGDPSLVLEGYMPEPGTLAEAAGVAWSSNEVQVLGERVGERLVVSELSRASN